MSSSRPSSEFLTIGVSHFLNADKRPTVVLDCLDFDTNDEQFRPVFTNNAFETLSEKSPKLFTDPDGLDSDTSYLAFRLWTASHTHQAERHSEPYIFAGHQWHQFDISGRWRIVSSLGPAPEDAHIVEESPGPVQKRLMTHKFSSSPAIRTRRNTRYFDCTAASPPPQLSDHVKFIRAKDWTETSAGAMKDWPYQLRTMINMIMVDPSPAVLFWGDDLISIYNEPYLKVAGSKHPQLMGQSVTIGWASVWEEFCGLFEKGRATGQATKLEDVLIFLEQAVGCIEESYLTLTVIPLLGEQGEVTCFYERVTDVTRQVLSQRRMTILLEVGHLTSAAKSLSHYWQNLLASIENFKIDIPFAALYSSDYDPGNTDHGLPGSSSTYWVEGTVGVPSDCLGPSFDIKNDREGLAQIFRKAQAAGGHATIDDSDECWPSYIVQEQDKQRGFGEVCKQATVYLLRPSNGTVTRGFLILGLNRRQPYNDNHRLFRHTLGRQIASSLASIVLFEDEVRTNKRRIEQAATDRALLSEELIQRARDTEIIENRFFRIAQISPVGICVLNKDGSIIYANDKFYSMFDISKGDRHAMAWRDSIWPEDVERVTELWNKLASAETIVNYEFRVKRPDKSANDHQRKSHEDLPFTWVLGSSTADIAEDGTFVSVTGTITDISQQKEAEIEFEKQAKEALESKRQQENFMDMTSHEIRNPLNAILQCADSIIRSLEDVDNKEYNLQELLAESIESAETIVHCAEHQKRIVDDILTLSKLDSNLMTVTPVPVQPVQLMRHALKLFHTQSQNAQVKLELEMDPSLATLNVDWVKLDSSRVLQIIINLLTNAIKFTASEGEGTVKIGLAASSDEPQSREGGIKYLSPAESESGTHRNPGDSTAEHLYLLFSIQDTGRGLSDVEQARLFNRFSQASPRTHIQYGGSGLGLYISRQLTELQGGKIGLASQEKIGSVFAFYIRAEKVTPETPLDSAEESQMKMQITPSAESTLLFQDWLSGSTILIVEDNLVNSRVLSKQLRPLVRETAVANNGIEALEYIRETRYWHTNASAGKGKQLTVILMDIEMPVMGGIACIKEIRRMQNQGLITEHLLVIAITANARSEQIRTVTDAGMDDVLTKPFKIKDLCAVLERAFRTWQIGSLKRGGGD